MTSVVIRRILTVVPTFVVTTFTVFLLRFAIPGDVALALVGLDASPGEIERVRSDLGLDQPLIQQYVDWLGNVLRGDLGESYVNHQAVSDIVHDRLTPTLELVVGAALVSIVVGVIAGIIAAVRSDRRSGRTILALSGLGIAAPDFWIAALGAGFFGLTLGWVPTVGYTPLGDGLLDNLRGVVLPVCVLAMPISALICRHVRSAMTSALAATYSQVARGMGLAPRTVYLQHAFRVASRPLVTYLPLAIGALVGATTVVESVFAIPGLGAGILQATADRDYPTIQGIVLVLSATVIGLNLLADLALVALDPLVRTSSVGRRALRRARALPADEASDAQSVIPPLVRRVVPR